MFVMVGQSDGTPKEVISKGSLSLFLAVSRALIGYVQRSGMLLLSYSHKVQPWPR